MTDVSTALRDLADDVPVTAPRWELLEQRGRRRARARLLSTALTGTAVAAALVTVGVALISAGPSPSAPAVAEVERFDGLSQRHVQGPVQYAQSPPVGGDHAAMPQICGYYDAPVANVHAVHSLEHGIIWITYGPTSSPYHRSTLIDFQREHPDAVIVSEYPSLGDHITVQAWGAQLELDQPTEARLDAFFAAYSDKGPEVLSPEGPVCSGTRQTVADPSDTIPSPIDGTGVTPEVAAERVVGMTKAEAERFIEAVGFDARVLREDGVRYVGTADRRLNRINLELTGGRVVLAGAG